MALNESGLILDSIFYEVPKLRILQGAYLKVEPGTVCCLFGRNGCGKSTLMKIAAGQIVPTSGLVIIDGERFRRRSPVHRFESIAYLPQDSMLPGGMKVERLLAIFPNGKRLREDELIGKLFWSRIDTLSGGERRYLEIRLLLSLQRKYVLLDEPFTGVEPRLIERISESIAAAAAEGAGLLVTDHYHHYTLPIANDAYAMMNGGCKHLNASRDLREQLSELGYMR